VPAGTQSSGTPRAGSVKKSRKGGVRISRKRFDWLESASAAELHELRDAIRHGRLDPMSRRLHKRLVGRVANILKNAPVERVNAAALLFHTLANWSSGTNTHRDASPEHADHQR
jgi:hypothetical protein